MTLDLIEIAATQLVSIYGGELLVGEIGYALSGNSIVFSGLASGAHNVELTYFARPAALSVSAPTNWLLQKFPAVYLHSALARAYRWRQNPQAEAGEKASVQEALAGVTIDHKRITGTGNTIIMNGGNPYAG